MKTGYIQQSDTIFYKHEISKNLPRDIYAMHTHNMYELLYFISGDATCVIEDRKYKLKKGDLILVRPMQYHFIQIDSPTDYERYDILFDPQRHHIESVVLLPHSTEVISLAGNTIANNIFKKCDIYRERCDAETFEKLLGHLLCELFYNITIFPQESAAAGDSVSPLVAKALHYINDHLTTITDIDQIAKHLFVSKSNLFRCFKNALHQTPKQYITQKRLLLANQRISMGERPTEICQSLGFGDYTSFYRNYVAFFGHSPTEK